MKITNKYNLPAPLVDAVTRNHKYTPKQYSVTALLKGPCQAILERRHDDEIEQDVSDMIWLIFGTAVHSILEKSQEELEELKENKFVVDMLNGYKLSGIFDLYNDATGTVTDYKTASVQKVLKNDWDEYRKQTLIYCWMLRQIGFDANRGEIVAMLKDHSKTKALQGGNYPQHPVYRIGWDFTDDDFKEIEEWIKQRFEELSDCEQMDDADLPNCTPTERWHKDDTYAIMKKGRKSAVKLFKTEGDAKAYFDNLMLDDKHSIVKREGADNRCDNYCKAYGCDYTTAMVNGCKLLSNPKIQTHIQSIKDAKIKQSMYTAEDYFQKMMDIAYSDVTDYMTFGQETVAVTGAFGPLEVVDPITKEKKILTKDINVVRFKDSSEVDGTLIQEVKQGKDGCSIKLVSKEFALKWLDKHYSEATELQQAQLEQLRAQTDKLKKESDTETIAEKVTIINDLPK